MTLQDTDGLLNQWAIDPQGNLRHASHCSPRVVYTCPMGGCGQELIVVAIDSEHYRAHLRHVGGYVHAGESNEHLFAKRIVAQRIQEWISGERPAPFIGRRCEGCGTEAEDGYPLGGATEVAIEGRCGERIADVLVRRGLAAPVAIEIFMTHAVDDAKAADLAALGIEWLEIRAEDVLSLQPWIFVRGTARDRRICARCFARAKVEHFEAELAGRTAAAEVEKARLASEQREAEGLLRTVASRRATVDALSRQQSTLLAEIAKAQATLESLGDPSQVKKDVDAHFASLADGYITKQLTAGASVATVVRHFERRAEVIERIRFGGQG